MINAVDGELFLYPSATEGTGPRKGGSGACQTRAGDCFSSLMLFCGFCRILMGEYTRTEVMVIVLLLLLLL